MYKNTFFNIELLYVFNVVAEEKSISKSTILLNMSQPAISKKIQQLEKLTGEKIFYRSSKGVHLTEEGTSFYKKSKIFLEEAQTFIKSIQINIHLEDITLGCLDSISNNLLSSFFKKNISKFKSTIITTNIFELIKAFNSYSLNVLIMDTSFKQNIKNKFEEYHIYSEPYYVVYDIQNTKLNNKKKIELTIDDISHFSWILYPNYCPIHQNLIKKIKEKNIIKPQVIEIDHSESILRFIDNSEFITILPYSQAIKQVTKNISNLGMKKIHMELTRNISIFTRTNNELLKISNNIYLDKYSHQ